MTTVYTRAAKGSALTWTEGDANITNLNTDKIELTDLSVSTATASSGGSLSYNDTTGVFTFTPADVTASGATTLDELTDVVITTPSTGEILIYNGTNWINGDAGIDLVDLSVGAEGTASGDGAISYDNTTGVFTYTPPTAAGIGALANVVEDTTPQLGGSLDVNGNSIVSASNGNIVIEPNGVGKLYLNADTIRVGDLNQLTIITTNGTGNLFLSTNDGTNSGNIVITAGANNNITLTPNGTGQTVVKNLEYNENIFALGTTGGTIAPNVANGNVQTITLNSALTINGFTSPVAGQSLTLIINGGTAYTSITSTMKFAGGIKTLTGTAGCVDILSVFYDGTNYWASLAKGFA
jgi:hypothetical protein